MAADNIKSLLEGFTDDLKSLFEGRDVREVLERNRGIFGAIGALLLFIAVMSILHQAVGGPHRNTRLLNSAFFSDDDGKTWFLDDVSMLPPFNHHGRTAVRAVVYRYGTGSKFVGYLEKFPNDQLIQIEAAISANPEQTSHWLSAPMQIKKPGDTDWISPPDGKDPKAAKAYAEAKIVVSPDGSKNVALVSPTDPDALGNP
jgi:hypothetical protein